MRRQNTSVDSAFDFRTQVPHGPGAVRVLIYRLCGLVIAVRSARLRAAAEDARHDQPNDRPRHRKRETKGVRGVERSSFLEEKSNSKAGKKPHDHSHHAGGAGRLQEKARDQADQAEHGRDQAEDPSPRRQGSDVIDDD